MTRRSPNRSQRRDRLGVVVVSHTQDYLSECLSSVLGQQRPVSRVVLIDNASPADRQASSVGAELGVEAIRLPATRSLGTARNVGCQYLDDCDLIVAMDGDDVMKPTFVHAFWGASEEFGADIVFGAAELFGAETGIRFSSADRPARADLRRGNFIPAYGLFRREMWRRAGGFDSSLPFFEDWDFWLSCAEQGARFHAIDEPHLRYRRHEASMLGASESAERDAARNYVRAKHLGYIWGPLQWRRWYRNTEKYLLRRAPDSETAPRLRTRRLIGQALRRSDHDRP